MSKQVYSEPCKEGFNWVVLRDDGSLHVYSDPQGHDADAVWYQSANPDEPIQMDEPEATVLFGLELLPEEPLYKEIVSRWRKSKETA
jgi:hypothetical protein